MARCDTCGNAYARTFQVTSYDGATLTFDCFECAIHRLAPRCVHCTVPVVGHGVEDERGAIFCCAHCARAHGARDLVDRSGGGQARDGVDRDPAEREVDATLEDSFPASDPPSYWARRP